MLQKTLQIRTSPHIKRGISTDTIMLNVVYAMLPVVLFAIYSFGLSALMVMLSTTSAAVLTEHYLCKRAGQASTVSDGSAVITGLLLGLTLPPNFPMWMGFVGGVLSIALGKYIFGGLGYNIFNPALVGRAVLQAAFPVAITTWFPVFLPDRFTTVAAGTFAFPFMEPAVDVIDGFSGATPLALFKFDKIPTDTTDLALGIVSGSTGKPTPY
ncbi:MAG: RnfABCDGE type electron transport complex subunit D [Saprospiraceae bacterium]